MTASLAALLVCTAGWAQQTPNSPTSPETSTKTANNAKSSAKGKHWTGILVDVGCMSKTLGAENMVIPAGPVFGAPHLIGWGAAIPQKTLDHAPSGNVLPAEQESFMPPGQQQPGQPGQQGTMPSTAPRNPEPVPGTMEQLPDPTNGAQARATRVNDDARMCAASRSTETVGLATGEGQVFQFDQDGNAKAKTALKAADIPPGKKIKAKVTGTLQDQSTVMVAAIEIKGAGKQASLTETDV